MGRFLLDEPTAGIHSNIIQRTGEVIKELKCSVNMAIILVEQYFDFAFDLSNYIYALKRVQIFFSGSARSVEKNS